MACEVQLLTTVTLYSLAKIMTKALQRFEPIFYEQVSIPMASGGCDSAKLCKLIRWL